MRLTRTDNGRPHLHLLDHLDFAVANRVEQGIRTTFRGSRMGDAHVMVEEQYLNLNVAGHVVTIRVHRGQGLSVFAASEAADGILFDIANYLAAHAAELGITASESQHQ
jgi:hypothetical protein